MTPPAATDTAATVRSILGRVDRGGVMISETELRYQLRHDPPVGELLDRLADLEAEGLIESQLYFRLTEAGEQLLCGERPPRDWAGSRPGWS